MPRDITLTPEQYDIVWEDLDVGSHVHPLEVRSHGRMMSDRAAIRRRVHQQLEARDWARDGRLVPDLEELFLLIGRAPVWLAMSWLAALGERDMHNAVAARSGDTGVVARFDPSGLRLQEVRGTGVILALLDHLPYVGAGSGQSISLPRSAMAPAGTGRQGDEQSSIYEPTPGGSGRYRQEIQAAERLFEKPRLRGGQIVAHARGRHGRKHDSLPLQWFDTEGGRWMMQSTPAGDDAHLLMAPADNAKLATRLSEMLNDVMSR